MERMKEIEARLAAIATELEADGADLNALEEEVRSLKEEKAQLTAEAEKRAALIEDVAKNAVVVETVKEERKMANAEIRNSAEYINAFAEYLKGGEDTECRALLSENVSGTVPIPDFVSDIVKTAWEKEGLMSKVKKSYVKGNLRIAFELSADGAAVHTEGTDAPSTENLVLGIVNLTPVSIKKWIKISDEAMDLRGEAFLRWVYEEVSYRIAKAAADALVAKIKVLGTVSTSNAVGAKQVKANPAIGTIAKAIAQLSDQAENITIVMNKQTWGDFKEAEAKANFARDIFEGCTVVFNNTLPAYTAGTSAEVYAIVGDFGYGAQANFPNGEGITLKIDDLSLAEADLVKIVGREYVGIDAVAPFAFVNIVRS